MKYGIGEMILVVIGILIALQVNNWNEERKRNLERIELVNSLNQELENHIDLLEARIKLDEGDTEKLNDAIKMIENQNITIPIDSLKQHISLAFYTSGLFVSFQRYLMAVNTGKIDLIEDDTFDDNMAILLHRRDVINMLREEHLEMAFSGPLSEIKEEYWEVYKPFEDKLNGFSKNDEDYLNYIVRPDVIAKIKNVHVMRQNIIGNMNIMLDTAKNIVKNFES